MHFRIKELEFRSPGVPASVETALRGLTEIGITLEGLTLVEEPLDSNIDVIEESYGCEVVADGSEAIRVVKEGLRRRLGNPIAKDERILLAGG